MKQRFGVAGLGLLLLLLGSAVVPPKAVAQDASSESPKRKVKTRAVPEYPPLAKQYNVTGKVKIEAKISSDGHVVETKVIGGSPLLVGAAIEALKKWRFEPSAKESSEVFEFSFSGLN
ncbi:MAG: energy transducer TonB [Candidatus Acidiferrales bacterium]